MISPVPTNRYAKPCKLFQDGICPLASDRCEFAHVKVSARMCYDYARGLCAYGDNCRWSHSPLARKQAGLRHEKKKEQEQRERERTILAEHRDNPPTLPPPLCASLFLFLPSASWSLRLHGH
ncbi:hypothetical protein OF83DRAFT_1176222 [Amylostereum chailletii]|nr:hypothetical protein OF83DRAFT_1176222 [Amylostereum chailletii]